MDISHTIIPKSDQLNADDLIGKTMTITITEVKGSDDAVQPISINFVGDNKKPFKPCKSMRRVLVTIWGADASKYIGKQLTLYRDDSVTYGGINVGGIRISHASHIEKDTDVLLTFARGKRRPFTVKKLVKPKISNFDAAKKAIAEGKTTIEKIQQMYEVTEEEIKNLQS